MQEQGPTSDFNRDVEVQEFTKAGKTQGWIKSYVQARESGMDVVRAAELAESVKQSKAEIASGVLPRKVEEAIESSSLEPDSKVLIKAFLEGASNRTIAETEGKGKSTISSKITQLYKILKMENPEFWKDKTAAEFRDRLEAAMAVKAKRASSVTEGQVEVESTDFSR